MLKDIDVRFFTRATKNYSYVDVLNELDVKEVTHQAFVDRYAETPHGRVDIELHSVYANGVRQLCITLNEG